MRLESGAGRGSTVRLQFDVGENRLPELVAQEWIEQQPVKLDRSSREGCVARFLGAVVWSMPVYASELVALADYLQGQGTRDSGRDQVLWSRRRTQADAGRRARLPSRISGSGIRLPYGFVVADSDIERV